MRCRKKPRVSVHGYSRCPAGTKGRRNTRAERRSKKCKRGGARKERVGPHKRKVCRA